MKRVYLKGVNVVIDAVENGRVVFIPVRSARMQPEGDSVTITDHELNQRYNIYWPDLQDEAGSTFGTIPEAVDYLSEFIGSFKFGGGVGNGDAVFVDTVLTTNDLPDPATLTGKYIMVQEGSGGFVVPVLGYRIGGNDPGPYFSDGTTWKLSRDLDATDIIVDKTQYNYSSSDKLNNLLKDIETKFNALDNVDQGSVTVHSDVTDAGRGAIITSQEAGDIYNTIDVHSDSSVLPAPSQDGDEVVVVGGQLVRRPRPIIISSPGWTTTVQDIDNKITDPIGSNPNSNRRISVGLVIPEDGLYLPSIDFLWSLDTTGNDFTVECEIDGNSICVSQSINSRIMQTEPKDSAGSNPNHPQAGTNNVHSYSKQFIPIFLNAGIVTLTLDYGPEVQNNIQANIAEVIIILKRIYNQINT